MKVAFLAALATGALAVAAGSAAAHGGPGRGVANVGTTKLVNTAAKGLGVTNTALKAAIVKSANARIDEAVADEDITAAQASDAKDEVADNLDQAYRLSRASTVASALGITTTKLNDAFRAARKTLALERIDAALKAGQIDDADATELKAALDKATLPGYKGGAGLLGGRGPKDGPAVGSGYRGFRGR